MNLDQAEFDVVVIGGGPAGSTAATFLARDGRSVLLLERALFPRYKIGESLWVVTLELLQALGVDEAVMTAGFAAKMGGTFFWGKQQKPWSIYFAEADDSVSCAYHVERARFDDILLRHAISCGAEVAMPARAESIRRISPSLQGVRIRTETERLEVRCRYVIDASGTHSKFSSQYLNLEQHRPPSLAIWSYFSDVNLLPEPDNSNVVTVMFARGWFWLIPIDANRVSIGLVVDPEFVEEYSGPDKLDRVFHASVNGCQPMRKMLASCSRLEPFHACRYAPRNQDVYYKDGILSVGDSACFIDPVFSTGVHLGMNAGCYAGYALNTILNGGLEDQAMDAFDRFYLADYTMHRHMTDDLFALNAHEKDPYWQRRQVQCNDLIRLQRRRERLVLLQKLVCLRGQLAAMVRCQNQHSSRMYQQFGAGRYRMTDFLNTRVCANADQPQVEEGYAKGGSRIHRFEPRSLIKTTDGQKHTAGLTDFALLEICRAPRSVADIISRLQQQQDRSSTDEFSIAERIGYWVDAGLLKSV